MPFMGQKDEKLPVEDQGVILTRHRVRTYEVTATHDTDNADRPCDGTLKFTGLVLISMPSWFVHECDRCHERVNLRNKYPLTQYEVDE